MKYKKQIWSAPIWIAFWIWQLNWIFNFIPVFKQTLYLSITAMAPLKHTKSVKVQPKHINFIKWFFIQIFFYKVSLQTYSIPNSMSNSNTKTFNGSLFLLLNTEFQKEANLNGFQLYAAKSGSINLQVNINICNVKPCLIPPWS